jgi:hypothetical protein
MFIAAEDAVTIPALESGKAGHARHPAQARDRARDAVEFAPPEFYCDADRLSLRFSL